MLALREVLLKISPGVGRGWSLATTLMLVAVLMAFGLTVVAVSLHSLSVSLRVGNLERARQMAESAISVAIEKLLIDSAYGVSRQAGADLEVIPRSHNCQGQLTFRRGSEVPFSTNNLAGNTTQAGYGGRAVPAHSAHLIGWGQSGGVQRCIETVVTMPPFPYAVACSGPLESQGYLNLAGIAARQELNASSPDVSPQKLLPAHLVSNGVGADAVKLGPETSISGDLRSAGGIVLDPVGTQVRGQIVRNGAQQVIPELSVASLDPLRLGRSQVARLDAAAVDAPAFQGFIRRQGNLTIDHGLVLDNGVLFVDGDLSIRGGIRGVGAVLATGQVQVAGGASLSSDDRLALVSGGALSLCGGPDNSYFQGMIYSGGSFQADQITLVGALIVQAGSARSTLNRTRVIYCPELTRLEVASEPLVPMVFAGSGPQAAGGLLTIQVGHQDSGYSVQDPDDDSSTSDLTAPEAARKIETLLQRKNLEEAASEEEILERLEALPPPAPSGSPVFALDPSQFLRAQDRIRIVLWEES